MADYEIGGTATGSPATTPWSMAATNEQDKIIGTVKRTIWTKGELNILGGFLWFMIVLTLIGNMSCFYAVYKNIKKILEHPFFQSNVFCVILSVIDVLLVLTVGIPAAVYFCSPGETLGDGMYNLGVVEAVLDYLVWVQLLIVVAICVDRAGHICRPLTYTFSIKAIKTFIACTLCVAIPFFCLTLPYVIASTKVEGKKREMLVENGYRGEELVEMVKQNTYHCERIVDHVHEENGLDVLGGRLFMSCTLKVSEESLPGHKAYLMYESIAHPFVLLLAVTALIVSNCLIVWKLLVSAQFQKNNQQRQDEVARSIKVNSIVSAVQALLLIASTFPLRIYQIEKRLDHWESERCSAQGICTDKFDMHKYTHHYIMISKVLVFVGPMFNPWLYPIRMASIRTFLQTKRKSVVSSARRLTVSSRGSTYTYRNKKTKYFPVETDVEKVADSNEQQCGPTKANSSL